VPESTANRVIPGVGDQVRRALVEVVHGQPEETTVDG
jgi:hypothetical protein